MKDNSEGFGRWIHGSFWTGAALLAILEYRYLRDSARPDDLLHPSTLLLPIDRAFTSYSGLTLPAVLSFLLALGLLGLDLRRRRRRPPRHLRRSRWGTLSLVLGATAANGVAALLVLEIVLAHQPRLLGEKLSLLPDRGRYLFDDETEGPRRRFDSPDLGYAFRPNLEETQEIVRDELLLAGLVPGIERNPSLKIVSFRTDERGLRLPNPPPEEPPLIVALGGTSVSDSNLEEERIWPRILARLIDGPVLNLGVDGYGASQAVLAFERTPLPPSSLPPSVAVLLLFEGDLLETEARFAEFRSRRGSVPISRLLVPRRARYEYSLVRALLRRRGSDRRPYLRTLWREPTELPSLPPARPGFLNPVRITEGSETLTFAIDPEELEKLAWTRERWESHPGWTHAKNALQQFQELCEDRKIKPCVVLLPRKARLLAPFLEEDPPGPRRLRRHFESLAKLPAPVEEVVDAVLDHRNSLAELIDETCALENLPFLDYTPFLEKKFRQGRLHYSPFSRRLSASGHAVLAKALLLEFRRRGWTAGREGPNAHPVKARENPNPLRENQGHK